MLKLSTFSSTNLFNEFDFMLWILFCLTHLIRGSFQWFTALLCFLVVEVSNGDFGMETQQKPINEKRLKIRIHHKTNENIYHLYDVLED